MQRRTAEAAAAEPAWPDDAIEVGRIVDAYGIKGWIKVQAYSADPQALFSSRRGFIQPPEGQAAAPARPRTPRATRRSL
jgi:16S rRNA processing protein RimM